MPILIKRSPDHEKIFESVRVSFWTDLEGIGQIRLYSFEYCLTTIKLAIEKAKNNLRQYFTNLTVKIIAVAQNNQKTFLFPFSYHSTDGYHQPIIFSV